MREIKFRARWKDTGKPIHDFQDEYMLDACNDPALIVEQYTGLKDKNGKEIYEGDVIETNGVDGHQLWTPDYDMSSYVMGFHLHCLTGDFSSVHNQVWDEGEVIGNIYENPELLT